MHHTELEESMVPGRAICKYKQHFTELIKPSCPIIKRTQLLKYHSGHNENPRCTYSNGQKVTYKVSTKLK